MKIDKQKIIFFHPGKTGGTSIEYTLRDMYLPNQELSSKKTNREIMFGMDLEYRCYLQHADFRLYELMNIPYQEYDTFTTVRRPYERILSCYFYNGKYKTYTFEEFILNDLEKSHNANIGEQYSKGHFSPQHLYVQYKKHKVDHVLMLENFQQDCAKIGLDVKYKMSKTRNCNQYKNYMDAYTQKTKDIVYEIYKEDFKLLGYKK